MALGRFDSPGSTYHVIQKAVAEARVFSEKDAREFYLARLGSIARSEGVLVLAFAIMDTHVHLILFVPRSLERFMRRVGTSFGIYYNRKHGRKGHVFGRKYFSREITDEEGFRRALLYVLKNPSEAGLHTTVNDLLRSDRTNYPSLVGRSSLFAHDASIALRYFGDDPASAREALFVRLTTMPDDVPPELQEIHTSAGDEEADRRWEARQKANETEERRARLTARGWTLESIGQLVALRIGIGVAQITLRSKAPPFPDARAAAAWLASSQLAVPLIRIAEWFGTNPSTVQRSLERGREVCAQRGIELPATPEKCNRTTDLGV